MGRMHEYIVKPTNLIQGLFIFNLFPEMRSSMGPGHVAYFRVSDTANLTAVSILCR